MCHGLIEKRPATVCVPDLLRDLVYQEPGWDGFGDDYPSVYSSVEMPMINEPLLRESSGLSDGALAEIVNDYSSVLKKLDSEEVDSADASAFASTGALSTWFDCFKDNICTVTKSTPKESALLVPKLSPADGPQDAAGVLQSVPKSRKSRKSVAGEQGHAQHDSEMDDVAPALIDEKRKRRMSSNRASAQRSRQRKQERLDELEILTAQLRLENATLSRRSQLAEQRAKIFQGERNNLAKMVDGLRKELDAIRQQNVQGSPDCGTESFTSGNHTSGLCNMVGGGEASQVADVKLETSSKGDLKNVYGNFDAMKRNISSSDLSRGIYGDLYSVLDSIQFDVGIGAEVPDLLKEEWYGSFTECLNA